MGLGPCLPPPGLSHGTSAPLPHSHPSPPPTPRHCCSPLLPWSSPSWLATGGDHRVALRLCGRVSNIQRPWATEAVWAAWQRPRLVLDPVNGGGDVGPPLPCTCLILAPGWPADSCKRDQKAFPTQGDGGERGGFQLPFLLAFPASSCSSKLGSILTFWRSPRA